MRAQQLGGKDEGANPLGVFQLPLRQDVRTL